MRTAVLVILTCVVTLSSRDAQSPPAGWRTFADPQKRFEFSYPESFGTPEPGTDSGFRNRIAAFRFSRLTGLGGEAVLTSGFIDVGVQALGGLYDHIARQVLPDADAAIVVAAMPPLTPANFCAVLASNDRVQETKLPPRLMTPARLLDAMRNINPVVRRCAVTDRVAVFHKETTFEAGKVSARQHLVGAIRFLDTPYSSFQLVRGGITPPAPSELDVLERIVRSFVLR